MEFKTDITLKNNTEIQELLKSGGKLIKENKKFFVVEKMNKYNLFCLGGGDLKKVILAENTKEAYKKFISIYKKELKQILNINDCALLCWTKENNSYTENGQKDLIKFKRLLK